MDSFRLIPGKYRFLSHSALKCIALIAMLIDHTARFFSDDPTILFFIKRTMGGY